MPQVFTDKKGRVIERVAKLDRHLYEPKVYMYFVKNFSDGPHLCRVKMNRKGRIQCAPDRYGIKIVYNPNLFKDKV